MRLFKGSFIPSLTTSQQPFPLSKEPEAPLYWQREKIERMGCLNTWFEPLESFLSHSPLLIVVKLIPRYQYQMSLFYTFRVEKLKEEKWAIDVSLIFRWHQKLKYIMIAKKDTQQGEGKKPQLDESEVEDLQDSILLSSFIV